MKPDILPFVQDIALLSSTGEISRVRGLFDDGARISILATSVFEKIKHRLNNWTVSNRALRVANSTVVPSQAHWQGTIKIGGVRTTGEFEVLDSQGSWSFLVGKPLLSAFDAIHTYGPDIVQLTGNDGRSVLLHNKLTSTHDHVYRSSSVLLLDWKDTESPVMAQGPLTGDGTPDVSTLLDDNPVQPCPIQSDPEPRTPDVMADGPPTSGESTEHPHTPGSAPLYDIHSVGEAGIFTRLTEPFKPKHVAAVQNAVTIGDDLTAEQRNKFLGVIAEYADCFVLNVSEVMPAVDAVHRLDIPEGARFNTKPRQRSFPMPQRQYLGRTVDDLLKADVIEFIEPSRVKCVSPVTLAQKAHSGVGMLVEQLKYEVNKQCAENNLAPFFDDRGNFPPPDPMSAQVKEQEKKWRMCINYDELNKVTHIPPMPPGDPRSMQQQLSGHRYVSTWDFASGFYAVEVAEESRPYTAFYVEGHGFFWFKRMPFGLTGAPTTFAYVTFKHMHDLITDGTMKLFVDDGGAAEDTFDGMLDKIIRVLKWVREKRLSLSAVKCSFFMRNSLFGGARVGFDGVLPDLNELTAIVNWPRPVTAANLATFLGLAGHFRDLIKDYARIEGPLHDLLALVKIPTSCSKSAYQRIMQSFVLAPHWKDVHTRTFIQLKGILTSEPVLRAPRWDGTPFIVTTDGSKDGFAGVLTQRQVTVLPNGKSVTRTHPIAFASKRTSKSEAKYPPFLLELAALKMSLDKFSDIIWGFAIEVETDCQALRDVLHSTKLNAHYARWRDGVLSHQIVAVRHIPGRTNVVADGISRQFDGIPRQDGDGSEWEVCEDWEAVTGLMHDIFGVSPLDRVLPIREPGLCERFKNEPLFLDVIDALLDQQQVSQTTLRNKARACHCASEYLIEDGKLWRLRGGNAVRARARVECVSRAEANDLAVLQHASGGHWGRDSIKTALYDCIACPKLDAIILDAIRACPQCKAFGPTHLNALLEPVIRRRPFELLVGDYLSLPVGKGGYKTLGVYVDVFSQHVYVDRFKVAGSAATTNKSLERIFNTYVAYNTFMTDGGKHFNNDEVRAFCEERGCKTQVVAAYSPWINGLCEGTNKLLLHVLRHICAPKLGEDDYVSGSWDNLPKDWPNRLDEAVLMLNNRILPRLGFTPRELLLGIVVNSPPAPLSSTTQEPSDSDIALQQDYVEQQLLDANDNTVLNAWRRKSAFDRRVQREGGEIIFTVGQLVQYCCSDLEYTLHTKRKLLAFWSEPHRIRERIRNSYILETCAGVPLKGKFSARRLRAFTPREGTALAAAQATHMQRIRQPPTATSEVPASLLDGAHTEPVVPSNDEDEAEPQDEGDERVDEGDDEPDGIEAGVGDVEDEIIEPRTTWAGRLRKRSART
ncbi:unnamed protein product [Peniophora sp. CBMAI 1063]|nr:unnamed protein product [Peniophora sp. CBMAI 1063]